MKLKLRTERDSLFWKATSRCSSSPSTGVTDLGGEVDRIEVEGLEAEVGVGVAVGVEDVEVGGEVERVEEGAGGGAASAWLSRVMVIRRSCAIRR